VKALNGLKALAAQMLKFGLVGVLNTLITLASIYIASNIFNAHYIAANAIGYTLGFLNSYICNKLWTFKSKGPVRSETLKFIAVTGVCYLLQLVFLVILKEGMGINKDMAQLVAMVFYTFINFLGHRYFTFRNK
jgi:putative flippase GtrA